MDKLKLPRHVYEQIMATIGAVPAESGGVFAVSRNDEVRRFYFDVSAGTGMRFYKPTASEIDKIVNQWLHEDQTLRFGGYIHSHPSGTTKLSPMDLVCAEMNIACNRLSSIYMGVVCAGEIYFYQVTAADPGETHGTLQTCAFEIVEDESRYSDLRRIPAEIESVIRQRMEVFEKGEENDVVF